MIENRRNQRFELRLPLEIIRAGRVTNVAGETRNLSSSGVLFKAGRHVAVGDTVEYLITLPKAPGARILVQLRCMGKILREERESAFAATLERYEFVREPA
jgi:hypothetical protein